MRWTPIQLKTLKTFKAKTNLGMIMVLPKAQEYGESVTWELRGYKKGVMGVLTPDAAFMEAIDAPTAWLDEARALRETLQEQYPQLAPELVVMAEKAEHSSIKELAEV